MHCGIGNHPWGSSEYIEGVAMSWGASTMTLTLI